MSSISVYSYLIGRHSSALQTHKRQLTNAAWRLNDDAHSDGKIGTAAHNSCNIKKQPAAIIKLDSQAVLIRAPINYCNTWSSI